ncbi:hypothetical protein ABH899_000002 [Paenibacillus sp. RC84]
MQTGQIRTTPAAIMAALGYKNIEVESLVCDIFSNQVIINVSGDCESYPYSIQERPERTAVTGL